MVVNVLRRARAALGRSLGNALALALRTTNPRVIYDGDGKNPYLSRWYILGRPTMTDGSSPFDRFGNPKPQAKFPENSIGLYVHRFHRSDVDRELHNHPWRWAISLVIAGGYREERRIGAHVVSRIVPPLSFNWIDADDFHRVDLLAPDAWSLFLVGPKESSWGFWSRTGGEFTPWREFLARKQRGVS